MRVWPTRSSESTVATLRCGEDWADSWVDLSPAGVRGSYSLSTTLPLCCRRSSPSPAPHVTACPFGISAQRSCLPPRSSSLQGHSSPGLLISRSDLGPRMGWSSSLRTRRLSRVMAVHRALWPNPLTQPIERALRHPRFRQWIRACSSRQLPATLCASW